MIKKFVEIKNIGKFENCSASGDVELKKLNVIYAENGRGKTTLCDILRSLKTGVADYIEGRKTLGCSDEAKIDIRLDGSNSVYQDKAWNTIYSDIEIFDPTFVSENVYAGEYVDHSHKKNLYQIIVGYEGVKLSIRVEELDSKIRDANRDISEKKLALQRLLPDGITLDEFLKLEEIESIDKDIESKEKEKDALSKADELLKKDDLIKISFPAIPLEFSQLLSKSIEGVSQDTEIRIKKHIVEHTEGATEGWISQGIGYVKDNLCPFCEQSIEGSSLFEAYKHYFSENYSKLSNEISNMSNTIERLFSDTLLLSIRHTIEKNISLCEFWAQFIRIITPSLDAASIAKSVNKIKALAQKYLEIKMKLILKVVQMEADFIQSLNGFESIRATIDEYNKNVEEINKLISSKKGEIKSGDLSKVKSELVILKATKQRYDTEINSLCENYIKVLETKKALDEEKEQAKSKLDEYTEEIFSKYESRINRLLEMFNAGFRITDTKRRYVGGTASSSYQILINDVGVGLGDNTTPLHKPSFRNTLSAGDKNTFALAFFIAQVEHDPLLAKKIIVLDDPFCSLDRSRRTCTKQLICKMSQRAKQVIVLSHDQRFLKHIWDSISQDNIKALQFFRLGDQNTTISEWDIQEDTKSNYLQNHAILTNYHNDSAGDKRLVVKTVRPLLEEYLRLKMPHQFSSNEWLGDFIKKIRESSANTALTDAKPILDELEDINDYSKKYHHETNPNADNETIDDGEIQAYVRRTLKLVGGF
jgi:wobble nucleotide-excising tRNase